MDAVPEGIILSVNLESPELSLNFWKISWSFCPPQLSKTRQNNSSLAYGSITSVVYNLIKFLDSFPDFEQVKLTFLYFWNIVNSFLHPWPKSSFHFLKAYGNFWHPFIRGCRSVLCCTKVSQFINISKKHRFSPLLEWVRFTKALHPQPIWSVFRI